MLMKSAANDRPDAVNGIALYQMRKTEPCHPFSQR